MPSLACIDQMRVMVWVRVMVRLRVREGKDSVRIHLLLSSTRPTHPFLRSIGDSRCFLRYYPYASARDSTTVYLMPEGKSDFCPNGRHSCDGFTAQLRVFASD
jgi:hypothetical protein